MKKSRYSHKEAIERGLTVHTTRPGGSTAIKRFIRDIDKPTQSSIASDSMYESD